MIPVGVATVDITPPAGLPMAGFGARTEPAIGSHDPLTVRALAVGDTALVVVDVIGLHEAMSARIRARCSLPDDRVVITALHNHGGPCVMDGRAGGPDDPAYIARLEQACIDAVDRAVAGQEPASLSVGIGPDPGVARNRRHPGGIVDPAVPVLRMRRADGSPLAVLVGYACHPVVLGADNRLWTADYPHYVRQTIEAACPGATAIFLTGCAGDANTGHSAYASQTLAASDARSFAMAERLGRRIGEAALAAPETPCGDKIFATGCSVTLRFDRRETQPLRQLAASWRAEAEIEPARKPLLGAWIKWAEHWADRAIPEGWTGRVSVLDWGGVPLVAMPGEVFAETGIAIRKSLGNAPAFVFSYADAVPGYIPSAGEFRFGGYEVDEAHRYFGLPAAFAPGSAEALADAAGELLARRPSRAG